jgi:hypothetical protein
MFYKSAPLGADFFYVCLWRTLHFELSHDGEEMRGRIVGLSSHLQEPFYSEAILRKGKDPICRRIASQGRRQELKRVIGLKNSFLADENG